MWEDVIAGINAGNYTNDELEEIFDSQKKALKKDCRVCDDELYLKQIKRLSKKSMKVIKKSKNIVRIRSKALQKAQEILKFYQNLDDSIIGIVDEEAYNHFDYKLKKGNTTLLYEDEAAALEVQRSVYLSFCLFVNNVEFELSPFIFKPLLLLKINNEMKDFYTTEPVLCE